MRTVKIDEECNRCYLYPDEWKGYIYAPEDEFDEVFVINDSYNNGNKNASWYKKAIEYLEENDINENETEILKALRKLYPNDTFDTFPITGYVQGEYADVIYKVNGSEWVDDLKEAFGDFYFGYVTELIDENENVHMYVSDSELWKYRNELEKFVRDILEIDEDEEIEILKSNGYTTIKNWEKIV